MAAEDFLCGISKGIQFDCTGKGKIGGLDRRVFIGNIKDLTNNPYTYDVDGNITAINFKPYGFLYEFIGPKFAHTAGDNVERNAGGSVNYPHTVNLKLFDNTAADKELLEEMTAADVFAVVETNDNQYKIYGFQKGLQIQTMEQNSGDAGNADTSRTVAMTGIEIGLAKIVNAGDYASTTTLLESYVG